MRPPLFKSLILLIISTAAHAQPQASTAYSVDAVDDWVSSGNYLIYSCGSQAPAVKSLLDYTYLYLQTAKLSTDTPPYRAFFHTAVPDSVSTILTSMTLGLNTTLWRNVSRRPTIICVNERDEGLKNAWRVCKNNPGTVSSLHPEAAAIFLCPVVFTLAVAPDIADCPTVNRAETRLIRNDRINNNQYRILVQMLAELYVKDLLGIRGTLDVRDENQCLGLPEYDALRNPSNYGYYAGYVRAGCSIFPSKVPIQHRRILQVVNETSATPEGVGESNQTSAMTSYCISNGTDSAPCPS